MLTKIILLVTISVLNTFFSPRNIKDRNKFIVIKLVNSLAMLLVVGLSISNLAYLKEILGGKHTYLIISNFIILDYTYIFLIALVSCISAYLAVMLALRRKHLRKIFLILFPVLIVISELKNYFIGLQQNVVNNEKFAIFFVLISLISWIGIYVFMLLRGTKKYYESA